MPHSPSTCGGCCLWLCLCVSIETLSKQRNRHTHTHTHITAFISVFVAAVLRNLSPRTLNKLSPQTLQTRCTVIHRLRLHPILRIIMEFRKVLAAHTHTHSPASNVLASSCFGCGTWMSLSGGNIFTNSSWMSFM